MKLRKLTFAALAAFALTLLLAGCSQPPAPTPTPEPTPEPEPSAQTVAATIVANFSCGSADAEELDLIKRLDVEVADPVTVEALAAELTTWTGLDFFINSATIDGETATIDWAANSTLVAGVDDRDFKEEFNFFDVASLNFFMMDSMLSTIMENFPVTEVYYTMDGGQPLAVRAEEDMASMGFPGLPVDLPYMGSPFYEAHNDVIGEG